MRNSLLIPTPIPGEVILFSFPGLEDDQRFDNCIPDSPSPDMDVCDRCQLPHLYIWNLRPVCALHIGRYYRVLYHGIGVPS